MANPELLDQVEKAVERVESTSAAEVVVDFHHSAADYRDADLLWAMVCAGAALAFQVWSALRFHPDWVLLNTVSVGLIGYLASRYFPGMRRLMISRKRRDAAVERCARTRFLELGVDQTRDRTGILLLVSRLERRTYFLPDSGLRGQLSPVFWNELNETEGRFNSENELLTGIVTQLDRIVGPLHRQCPRSEDDVDELPNRPVQAS